MSMIPNQQEYIKFKPHHHTLPGQFPSNLRYLHIDLGDLFVEIYKPFQFICNEFLSNLENLKILKVRTRALHLLDMNNVQLPKHLTSFELHMDEHRRGELGVH
ncbi:unnamed protein product [Ambrosiozyma monospora]|uniref:Unnamed protein product n=1 Tax=Ambrosiozyma monospora TaxID=43982 RepID=A0ACB5TYP2_AMBMO|nr:unnamed protein product [Ambrosiozyma monospora]